MFSLGMEMVQQGTCLGSTGMKKAQAHKFHLPRKEKMSEDISFSQDKNDVFISCVLHILNEKLG